MSRSVRGDGQRQEKWVKCLNKGLGFFTREQVDQVLSSQDNLRNFDLFTLERTQREYAKHYGEPHEEVARWVSVRQRQSSTWRAAEADRIRKAQDPAAFLAGLLPD